MIPASLTNQSRIMDLHNKLTDILLSLPQGATIGGGRYNFYAPTLGISMMASRYIHALDLDKSMTEDDSTAHILDLASKRRDDLCRLIVLFTLSGKEEAWDASLIERRAAAFVANISDTELVMLLTMVLKQTDLKAIYRECGITADRDRQSRIASIRRSKGNTPEQYGGHTVFGSMIDRAAERYGWTKDYIVWGIDLASLRLMLADSIGTTHLSDEERKQLGVPTADDTVIDAGDPASREKLRNYHWS